MRSKPGVLRVSKRHEESGCTLVMGKNHPMGRDTARTRISQNRAYTAARPAVSLPLHFILTFLMLYVSMYDNQ